MENRPLVSVVVITYNSANYVLETLESVATQTYQNIELIISDDASKDNTIEICRKWISQNQSRFVRTKIVIVEKNTGTAGNCNRGIRASKGDWFKLCAGDDLLLPNCLSDNLNFAEKNPDAFIFYSNMIMFRDGTNPREIMGTFKCEQKELWEEGVTAEQQYQIILKEYFGNTPTLFIGRKVFDSILYDESFPLIEDYSLILSTTKAGFKLKMFDKDTVMYRVNDNSTSHANISQKLFSDFYRKRHAFDKAYRYPNLKFHLRTLNKLEYYRKYMFDKLGLNVKNPRNEFLFNASEKLMMWPVKMYTKLKR